MLERSFAGNAKSGIYQRVLAPLLILVVTLVSLAVLVFLGSRALSCASHVSAQIGGGPQAGFHAGLNE